MSENIEEIKFLSSDGEHNVYAKFMWPEGEIKGIVQICHGMNGYIGKYDKMASFLLISLVIFSASFIKYLYPLNSPKNPSSSFELTLSQCPILVCPQTA